MFWESVLVGLKVFLYWETYVAGLEYIAIWIIPIGFISFALDKVGLLPGCLTSLLMSVLQVAAVAVFIFTLSGIILGFSEDADWGFPWIFVYDLPWEFLKLVGFLLVASIVLTLTPVLGRLNSLHTLLLGGISLAYLLNIMELLNPGIVLNRVTFIPDFWFTTGLIVVGGVLSWIGIIAVGAVITAIRAALGEETEDLSYGAWDLLMHPLVGILGFIPVFIYGAWLGAQLRGGI